MSLPSKSEDNTPWGCIGTVIAALIMGGITVWLQFRPGVSTPMPQDIDLVPVTIINSLRHDVDIYVGDEYDSEINALSAGTIKLDREPVNIKFIVEKETMSDGTPIGDDMSGTFHRVFEGETLIVDHILGDNYYFYPIINNYSDLDCTVIVNDGHPGEKNSGIARAGKTNVKIGYYRWHRDSNLTLYCGEQHWWWGIRNGEGSNSMNDLITSDDGSVTFSLNK